MKLRYIFLALFTLTSVTELLAQTITTTSAAAKARSARSIYNDVRQKKYQKATGTILNDRDVARHVNLNKDLKAKALDPNLRSNLKKAKADIRRDPFTFAERNAKDLQKLKPKHFKWFHHKTKRRLVAKK